MIPDGSELIPAPTPTDEAAAADLMLELLEQIKDQLVVQNEHLESVRKLFAMAIQTIPAQTQGRPAASTPKTPEPTRATVSGVIGQYLLYLRSEQDFSAASARAQDQILKEFTAALPKGKFLAATFADISRYCSKLPLKEAMTTFDVLSIFYGWYKGKDSPLHGIRTPQEFLAKL
jgi:hypothetical protein